MAAKTTLTSECSTKTVIYEAYRHAEKSGAMISRLRWLRPHATIKTLPPPTEPPLAAVVVSAQAKSSRDASGADQNDLRLPPLRAGMDLDALDQFADTVHCLGPPSLVRKERLKFS